VVNAWLYGGPLASGYGGLDYLFSFAHVATNTRLFTTWFIEAEHPLVVPGLVLLLVPLRRFWPDASDRSTFIVLVPFTALLIASYLLYASFDAWWYLRFLLPMWPFLMLGAARLTTWVARLGGGWIAAAAVLVLILGLAGFRGQYNPASLRLWRAEQRFADVARLVRDVTPVGSVVLAMQHSGSLRYYGDRVTLRYDVLDEMWLDRAVDWLAARGTHPYLVLEEWELPRFREQFAGQSTALRLDEPVHPIHTSTTRVYLFDLASSATDTGPSARP
jgi:hypothetical protein